MLTKEQFSALLNRNGTLVIDGALASELEVRGNDLNHPLWSAKILEEDPTCIKQVHLDYYIAGADIAITASYQASTQGFAAHLGFDEKKAATLMKRSVRLARLASEEAYGQGVKADRTLLVAGSVGPYGAFLADGSEYRGDYELTKTEFKAFHRDRIKALVEEDVDLLAIETMPQAVEIEAVLELLRDEFPSAIAWLTCMLKDASHISDGTSIENVLAIVHKYRNNVFAFGANCIPSELVTPFLDQVEDLTDLPLVCYPNSGEVWDAVSKTWSDPNSAADTVFHNVQKWRELGARLIGGCCRTGPKDVIAISQTLEKVSQDRDS